MAGWKSDFNEKPVISMDKDFQFVNFSWIDLGKVSRQEKLVEFSTKRGGGIRIGRFSTKKNIGSKQ